MTEAARRLSVSQPAISAVLKQAEQHLGLQLFNRVGGRLQPTAEAIALLPDVEEIFARLEALERSAQGLRGAHSGVISIATAPTLANVLLPTVITAFLGERPRVRVVLNSNPTPQTLSALRDRTCDIGVIYEPASGVLDDFAVEAVGNFHVACALHQGHPLAAKAALDPADLRGVPIVTFGPDTPLGARLARVFRDAGVPLHIVVESSSSSASLLMAGAGAGVALVDAAGARSGAFSNLVVRDFLPRIEYRVLLVHRRDRPRSRLADAFAAKLKQVVQQIAPDTRPPPDPPAQPRAARNRAS